MDRMRLRPSRASPRLSLSLLALSSSSSSSPLLLSLLTKGPLLYCDSLFLFSPSHQITPLSRGVELQ
eukprot:scaffold23958_cov26-Tisochrysis_lutea.AAC.1